MYTIVLDAADCGRDSGFLEWIKSLKGTARYAIDFDDTTRRHVVTAVFDNEADAALCSLTFNCSTVRKIDWQDFLNNDDNPDLVRMSDTLMKDPIFEDIIGVSQMFGKPAIECTDDEIQLYAIRKTQ